MEKLMLGNFISKKGENKHILVGQFLVNKSTKYFYIPKNESTPLKREDNVNTKLLPYILEEYANDVDYITVDVDNLSVCILGKNDTNFQSIVTKHGFQKLGYLLDVEKDTETYLVNYVCSKMDDKEPEYKFIDVHKKEVGSFDFKEYDVEKDKLFMNFMENDEFDEQFILHEQSLFDKIYEKL